MREKLVLIDGHSILNRAFYGVPELTNSEGLHTNAVYGFLNILFKILAEEQPQYLAVAFDLKAPTFRHKMYDAYKGTRKPMPEPPQLHEQVPVMKEVLTAMGVPLLMKEGYEADDLLGTVAKRMEKEGLDVSVVSGDRDLLQLATEHIMIRIPKTKRTGTEIEDYHAKEVLEKYQVTPPQIIELKAMMGDASDNIPGLPGVGERRRPNWSQRMARSRMPVPMWRRSSRPRRKMLFWSTMIWQSSAKNWRRSIPTAQLILCWRMRDLPICTRRKPLPCSKSWSLRICWEDFSVMQRIRR